MKIAVINNTVPFIRGGAEVLAENLVTNLRKAGHHAIQVRIPFQWHPQEKLLESMMVPRLLHIEGVERVICLKFPVYGIEHPNKVVWLLHQFRQAYDLWGTTYGALPDNPSGNTVRKAIQTFDTRHLSDTKGLYSISRVVSKRLKDFNNLDAKVLTPPLEDPGKYRAGDFGDYLFFPSRINAGKRQLLAIEALLHTRSPVRLVIAGPPDSTEDSAQLKKLVQTHKLNERVQIIDQFISEERKVELLSGCAGVVYPPYDEDFGYITLEGFQSSKPVVTCRDSGGPLDLVVHDSTGLISDPEPKALAESYDKLFQDKASAKKMGLAAFDLIAKRNLNWASVVETLTT